MKWMSLWEVLDIVHVDYLKSSKDRIPLSPVWPDILRRIVARNDHILWSDLGEATIFILCEERLMLRPPFQVA